MAPATWTDGKRRFFLELLLDQKVQEGNMGDTGNFKAAVWKNVSAKFNNYYESTWDVSSFKTEYGNSKAKFQMYEYLMAKSGQPFSFNEESALVEATSEQWDSLMEVSSPAKISLLKSLRTKPYVNMDVISDLLGGELATGQKSVSHKDFSKTPETRPRKKMRVATFSDDSEDNSESFSNQTISSPWNETPVTPKVAPKVKPAQRITKTGANILAESLKETANHLANALQPTETERFFIFNLVYCLALLACLTKQDHMVFYSTSLFRFSKPSPMLISF